MNMDGPGPVLPVASWEGPGIEHHGNVDNPLPSSRYTLTNIIS